MASLCHSFARMWRGNDSSKLDFSSGEQNTQNFQQGALSPIASGYHSITPTETKRASISNESARILQEVTSATLQSFSNTIRSKTRMFYVATAKNDIISPDAATEDSTKPPVQTSAAGLSSRNYCSEKSSENVPKVPQSISFELTPCGDPACSGKSDRGRSSQVIGLRLNQGTSLEHGYDSPPPYQSKSQWTKSCQVVATIATLDVPSPEASRLPSKWPAPALKVDIPTSYLLDQQSFHEDLYQVPRTKIPPALRVESPNRQTLPKRHQALLKPNYHNLAVELDDQDTSSDKESNPDLYMTRSITSSVNDVDTCSDEESDPALELTKSPIKVPEREHGLKGAVLALNISKEKDQPFDHIGFPDWEFHAAALPVFKAKKEVGQTLPMLPYRINGEKQNEDEGDQEEVEFAWET